MKNIVKDKISEPIRVLHVVQRMEAAGLQSFIMNIYRVIDREKIQFDFLTHYTERQFYDDEIERLGGRIYRLSVRDDKNLLKYIKGLNVFFSEHPEYKVVHGHMDSLGYFYLKAAKKAGVPCRIAHSHTVIKGRSPRRLIRHLMNRLYSHYANVLLACSDEAGKYMFGNLPFKVINNPIDVERFRYNVDVREKLRKELGIGNRFVIGNVGRFSLPKNHSFILSVFKEFISIYPNSILMLIGKGELENKIKRLGKDLGIDNKILYLGVRKDVEKVYQAMDVFLFPSLYEGLGIVAIEAQISGLPIFTSNNVPKLALVTEKSCALPLSLPPKEWAKKIAEYTKDNIREDSSEKIKKAGFDVKDIIAELLRIYQSSR